MKQVKATMEAYDMNRQEHLLGFDIRYECDVSYVWDIIKQAYPGVTHPRSYDRHIWPSRFRDHTAEDGPDDPLRACLHRPPSHDAQGKCIVYSHMVERRYFINLWENLGSMLLYHTVRPGVDTVAAFTLVAPDSPGILCDGSERYFNEELASSVSFAYPESKTPTALPAQEWRFLGYEVVSDMAGGLFRQGPDFLDGLPMPVSGPGYRNAYGLVENFAHVLEECRFVNAADPDHCPYFIYGIYEARDVNRLTLA